MSNITANELAHVLEEVVGGKGFLDHERIARALTGTYNIERKMTGEAVEENLPIKGQVLRWADLSYDSSSIEPNRGERIVTDVEHANVVCSDVDVSWDGMHKPLIDIDLPVHVVESSEGKSHLYIDKAMPWDDVVLLLMTMQRIGLVERGYVYASVERGYTSVRVPWALKGDPAVDAPENVNV